MNAPEPQDHNASRRATVNGLAIVGFVALIVGGMFLIIYAARFIPETLSRLAGAVYLSPEEAVNEEETPVEEEPEAPIISSPESPATPTRPATGTTTPPRTVITPVPQTPTQLYGYPDLTVEILGVGYLRTSSAQSFVSASRIDEDDRAAIRFRVRNTGTNLINFWDVEIEYPSATGDDTYRITSRDLLRPNGYKDFTFGFDTPDEGSDRFFTVVADPDNRVRETSDNNNTDRESIDVGTGSSNNNNDDISCDLEVSPSRIDEDDRATLRWETDGDVDSASINEGIGSVDEDGGSERVSPNEDTTYRMTVRGDGETETCTVTLRVDED